MLVGQECDYDLSLVCAIISPDGVASSHQTLALDILRAIRLLSLRAWGKTPETQARATHALLPSCHQTALLQASSLFVPLILHQPYSLSSVQYCSYVRTMSSDICSFCASPGAHKDPREPMTHHVVMSCSLIPSITRRWCHVHCSSLDVTRRWSSDRYLRYLYLYVVSWIDISDILSFIIY